MPSAATGPTSVDWLMHHARRHPLLTAEEEIKLSRQVQAWIPLKEKENLTKEEQRIARAGKRAYEKFFMANIRLVIKLAGKYSVTCETLTIDDLIQEGMFGLQRAIMKFDYSRGYKFSTYAFNWVRQTMCRAMSNQDRSIRLPCSAFLSMSQAKKYMAQVFQETGKVPPMEEVAKKIKVEAHTLKAYFAHVDSVMSLDAQLKGKSSDTLTRLDTIADPNSTVDPLDRVTDEIADCLGDMVSGLEQIEQEILKLRYYGDEPMSYVKIGEELNLGRQTCNNIHAKALKKLRYQIATRKVGG